MAESDFTPPEGFEITGSIRSGNRRYGAGDEEAFAASGVKEADFERLVESGVISVENVEESSGKGDETEASFASESAEEAAAEAGLTLEDFEGREPSGKTGYTVADVEALAEEQQQEEE